MMRTALRFAAAAALLAACSGSAAGAGVIEGLTVERLNPLHTPGTGARPLALGGAYAALANDPFALIYNPACLTQMTMRELSIGLDYTALDMTNTFAELSSDRSSSASALSHIAFAYPYPTYRGSLVLAFGVFKTGSSSFESLKTAYLDDIAAAVRNLSIQSGSIYEYRLGFGVDLSPRIAAGAALSIWDEGINFKDDITTTDSDSIAFLRDEVTLDLDGVSFDVGLLFRIGERLNAALAVSSPAWLTYEGDGVTNYDITYLPGREQLVFDEEFGVIEDDVTIPMRIRGGLALNLPHLSAAADLIYCDYGQTKYNGVTIVDDIEIGGGRLLDQTLGFAIGVEARPLDAPFAIRGGFSYAPLELATLEEIAYVQYDAVNSVVADFDVVTNRRYFSFGAGGVIDEIIGIDAALILGAWERETSVVTERRETTTFLLSGSYRF